MIKYFYKQYRYFRTKHKQNIRDSLYNAWFLLRIELLTHWGKGDAK